MAQDALRNAVRMVAEPRGAAALAALLSGGYRPHTHERAFGESRKPTRTAVGVSGLPLDYTTSVCLVAEVETPS